MRADFNLAPMLQYENIAWYENGKVRILDRRIFPIKKEFFVCNTHEEVAKAIKDMVTQSAGPFTAAPMGMALAAFECRDKSEEEQIKYLTDAAYLISNARPSTAKRMKLIVEESVLAAKKALMEGKDTSQAIVDRTIEMNNERYTAIDKIAKNLITKIPNHGHVMTYCWAETIVGMLLRNLKEQGKDVKFYCNETRPYFQGSRLTATCIKDMGFDVTVITDGMPAFVMEKEGIDVFTTAADAICRDGSVINKVGTCNTAIVAKYFGVPYYVTGAPETVHGSAKDVVIEMRDAEFPLYAMGERVADRGVKGYYPSFDATPPELVTGIVTDYGIFAPDQLTEFFKKVGEDFRVIV